MDIDLLRGFLAITDTGSFTLAGERTGRTQSAVSQQIKRLEAEIGRPVLDRNAAGVRLTEYGHRLLPHAREILSAHDRALAEFDRSETTGEVSLGMPEIYAETLVPRILPTFQAAYPKAEISLVLRDTPTLMRLMHDAQLDLCFITDTEARPIPGAKRGVVIRRERPIWVAALGRQVEHMDPLPLITWSAGTAYRDAVIDALEAAGQPFRIAVSTQSIGAMRTAVAAGLGAAVITRDNLTSRLRQVPDSAGLPALPDLTIRMQRATGRQTPIAKRLEAHILTTLAPDQPA